MTTAGQHANFYQSALFQSQDGPYPGVALIIFASLFGGLVVIPLVLFLGISIYEDKRGLPNRIKQISTIIAKASVWIGLVMIAIASAAWFAAYPYHTFHDLYVFFGSQEKPWPEDTPCPKL